MGKETCLFNICIFYWSLLRPRTIFGGNWAFFTPKAADFRWSAGKLEEEKESGVVVPGKEIDPYYNPAGHQDCSDCNRLARVTGLLTRPLSDCCNVDAANVFSVVVEAPSSYDRAHLGQGPVLLGNIQYSCTVENRTELIWKLNPEMQRAFHLQ